MRHWKTLWLVAIVLVAWAAAEVSAESDKPLRLFILSGQSNMAALKEKESFTPKVTEAFADDEVIVVKHAQSGQLIRMWYKDWELPEGEKKRGQGRNGRHYNTLMEKVTAALQGRKRPDSVTFVWMQGEADARIASFAAIYQNALEGVIKQLETDLARTDLDVVVGRISDYGNPGGGNEREGWMPVREALVAFAVKDKANRAWVDTDDLNGKHDGLHYDKDGYQVLGERFAEKAIALIKGAGDAK